METSDKQLAATTAVFTVAAILGTKLLIFWGLRSLAKELAKAQEEEKKVV
jgi:hypothetical protein